MINPEEHHMLIEKHNTDSINHNILPRFDIKNSDQSIKYFKPGNPPTLIRKKIKKEEEKRQVQHKQMSLCHYYKATITRPTERYH